MARLTPCLRPLIKYTPSPVYSNKNQYCPLNMNNIFISDKYKDLKISFKSLLLFRLYFFRLDIGPGMLEGPQNDYVYMPHAAVARRSKSMARKKFFAPVG